ncbi:MAG: MotA/TolQ/ExbB proton channel family protein [Planctomycetota bacterium]
MKTTTIVLALTLGLAPAAAQQDQPAVGRAAFDEATALLHQQLEDSLSELAQLRDVIAAEKVPMSQRLAELEADLATVKAEFQDKSRALEVRALDLNTLRQDIKYAEDDATFVQSRLSEYLRDFEAAVHVTELDQFGKDLERVRLLVEDPNAAPLDVHAAQTALIERSIQRLRDGLGGVLFRGTAVDPSGLVTEGTFALIGPTAVFRSADGRQVGAAEQRLGSLRPTIVAYSEPALTEAAGRLVESGAGELPLDTTLGNAHKIDATKQTFLEHVQAGGPVMYPIFAMATAALLVALYKWIRLLLLRRPNRRQLQLLLEAVGRGDQEAAREQVAYMRGPLGAMLKSGVDNLGESRELVEEVMYESVLKSKLRLQSLLPFIAICAASAPLLGLLGTVTGIIDTFKLITVFGSGDVGMLSGGISEALITTEFGLIVAIPSLLLHAFLSRKVRAVIGELETNAVAFVNQFSKTPAQRRRAARGDGGGAVAAADANDPVLVRRQIKEVLHELLGPLANGEADGDRTRTQAS